MQYTSNILDDIKTALGDFWRDFDIWGIFYDLPSNDLDDLSITEFEDLAIKHELDNDKCYDYNDKLISFSSACNYMSLDIAEYMHIHSDIDTSTGTGRYKWLELYSELHEQKYDEEFAPFYGGEW